MAHLNTVEVVAVVIVVDFDVVPVVVVVDFDVVVLAFFYFVVLF